MQKIKQRDARARKTISLVDNPVTRPPLDVPTLAEETARRLILAGIPHDDPGLLAIRDWNASVYARTKEDTDDRQACHRRPARR